MRTDALLVAGLALRVAGYPAAAGIAWWTMGAEVAATTALGVLVGLRVDRGPLALRTAAVAAMASESGRKSPTSLRQTNSEG